MGLHVLWLEVLRCDISIQELKGLYQFKKPKGPDVAYFSPWGDHGHIVEGNPALKKGYRKVWFVAEGVTWAKGSCPVQEVGREVKKFVDRLRGAQRGSDVLEESRLWRAGLIDRSPPPTPGGYSCIIRDSAVPQKGSRQPRVPEPKGKSQGTFHSRSKGTPRSKKRKFRLVSTFPDELRGGDLDPASNKEVSHLARCFYYSAENVTSEVAEETDKSHCLLDLDSLVAAQSEVDKLRGELQSCQSREDQLAREVKTLQERIAGLSGEKARVEKDCDELRATNEDLLSRQKTMAEDAFSLIMTEVWSVDPKLEVPRVHKFVNKATILKTIAERKKSSHARSGTPRASAVACLGYPYFGCSYSRYLRVLC
ncbi:uncharacterized protein LOC102613000 [Citrus sinensis]|uniref:uncharacterized protein LOC102613000 n=1 Tax=Citrus sinensis TaxID=2711 RepID=UPI0003D781BD|nr:uncharacterized protein LOC102613000 [Citrus sinensis]